MRIVAGRLKGRALLTPKGEGIRPTSDRLRETIFNVLSHAPFLGGVDVITGALVLDIFAGTGAFGFEAISRGAAFAGFIDIGVEARGLIRGNIEAFGLGGITRILKRDATRLGPIETFDPFTLVFVDPPYGQGLGEQALASAIDGGWLAKGAIIVLEERHGMPLHLPKTITVLDQRSIGEAQMLIGRFD